MGHWPQPRAEVKALWTAGSPAAGPTGVISASPFPSLKSLDWGGGQLSQATLCFLWSASVIGRARGLWKEGQGAVGSCGQCHSGLLTWGTMVLLKIF